MPLKWLKKLFFLESILNLSCSGQLSRGEKQQIAQEEKYFLSFIFVFVIFFLRLVEASK